MYVWYIIKIIIIIIIIPLLIYMHVAVKRLALSWSQKCPQVV